MPLFKEYLNRKGHLIFKAVSACIQRISSVILLEAVNFLEQLFYTRKPVSLTLIFHRRFCPYTGKYGSDKTRSLAYITKCL